MEIVADLVITRIFDAPREQVSRAFADNEHPAGDAAVRTRLEFHDEEGGRTRVVLTEGPYGPDPELEGQARESWSARFVKIDKMLSRSS